MVTPKERKILEKLLHSPDQDLRELAKSKLSEPPLSEIMLFLTKQTNFHALAEAGQLDKVPKGILTEQILSQRDNSGHTVIHKAAMSGCLLQVPKEFIHEVSLSKRTRLGVTAFHLAAENGHLDQIPQELLTTKKLLQANNDCGMTALHFAALCGHLDKFPKELLTAKNLLLEDIDDITPFQHADANNYLDQLLGLELTDKRFEELNREWYEKNLNFCSELRRSKENLTPKDDSSDIELF